METTNDYAVRFGPHVADYKAKTGRLIVKYVLWLLLPVIFLIAGAISFISPDTFGFDPDDIFLTYLFFGAGAICVIGVCVLLSHYTAQLFEHGIVLKKGSKITEWDFSEIDGVSYTVNKTSVNYIPVATTRVLEILPKQGKLISIPGLKMQNFKVFAEHLEGLYSEFVIAGLTKENIKTKTIRFGKKVILENGVFIYKNKKNFPLEDILGLNTANGVVSLEGKNAKGKKAMLLNIPANQAYNLHILSHVIYKLREKGKTTYTV